jgi:hypothetical protein
VCEKTFNASLYSSKQTFFLSFLLPASLMRDSEKSVNHDDGEQRIKFKVTIRRGEKSSQIEFALRFVSRRNGE